MFLETPNTRAIALIGIPSARCSRRISAQSSTDNTPSLPGSTRARVSSRGSKFGRQAARLALAQLPRGLRRRVLIRTDSGGGTHEFLTWLTKPGRRLAYSVGFTITEEMQAAIGKIPAAALDAGL